MASTDSVSEKAANPIGRRDFLCTAAAAVAAPYIIPGSSLGLANTTAPSNRITVGLIGCGGHGVGWNLDEIFRSSDVQVVAVCDVDSKRLAAAKKKVDDHYGAIFGKDYRECHAESDFRKLILREDIDAVDNCTPDHWHVIPSIMAAKCGKDIICEKPLTLFIDEGKALCKVVREHGRVFQTASENRSIDVYRRLIELVRGGVVGKLKHIEVRLPRGNSNLRVLGEAKEHARLRAVEKPPAHLDYDMWLGQAPTMPYVPARVHGNFRWHSAFSGGILADWGAHLCDLAQWGHNTEHTGPVEVEGKGDFPPSDSVYNTPATLDVRYKYADGVTMTVSAGRGDLDPRKRHDGPVVGRTISPGIRFEGTDGWIESHHWRGTLKASRRDMLDVQIDPEKLKLYCPSEIVGRRESIGGEHRNFYDCVKSREDCYAPAEIGHRSITIAHIGNISMLLGRKLQWNPEGEKFVNDEQANAMLTREQREPWTMQNIDSWIKG